MTEYAIGEKNRRLTGARLGAGHAGLPHALVNSGVGRPPSLSNSPNVDMLLVMSERSPEDLYNAHRSPGDVSPQD
jgi:hypothetical protein